MSPHRRKEWLKLCTAAVGFLVIVALGRVVIRFGGNVTDQGAQLDRQEQAIERLTSFSAASRESRIEFQARETFLLCSRDLVKTVIPERRAEVAAACDGYATMDEAIATERAKQQRATG